MKHPMTTFRVLLCTCVVPLLLACCTTISYRDVQADFNDAAAADIGLPGKTESPLTSPDYQSVHGMLTNTYIMRLDARLQPNAWLLRSFCEWRMNETADSRRSAARGLRAGPASGSRDDILLTLLEPMNIDTAIRSELPVSAADIKPETYFDGSPSLERRYRLAYQGIVESEGKIQPNTPESTKYYLAYQKWRILHHWSILISSIADRDARHSALDKAEGILGAELSKAKSLARDSVPPNHPLRSKMR